MERKIESIVIENIGHFQRFEAKLGAVNIIKGDNATGKTTILETLRAVFDGGHRPDLLRTGADSGRVVLTLSDGAVIEKIIKANKTEVKIRSSDGSKVKREAEWLNRLAHGFAYDPLRFITADKKKRMEIFQAALQLTFTAAEMEARGCGTPKSDLDLDGLIAFREGVYERRRDANVQRQQIESTIATLRSALPNIDGMPEARAQELRTKVADLRSKKNSVTTMAVSAANIEKANAKTEYERAKAELERNYNAEIARIDRECNLKLQEELADINAELEQATGDLSTAESDARAAVRAEETRRSIERFETQRADKNAEWKRLNAQLAAIDALKAEKLENSPVAGLEPRDGEFYYGDVLFDRVNTQKKYSLAFELATQLHGDLPLLIGDDAEHIVGHNWEEFKAAAIECGFQVLVARAEAGAPLTVESAV